MRRAGFAVFVAVVVALSGTSVGQEAKKDAKPSDPKAKGFLPPNWKDLGLTDEQKQKVYTVQNKYNEEIDRLEAQIKELKAKMARERLEVLSAEQKKRLEDIVKAKVGAGK